MNPFRNRAIISSIEKLPPAYFALVMATGIVSIAAFLLGYRILGTALLGFNGLAFVMLWGLFLLRGLMFPRAVLSDFTDHVRGVGFFTAIAGACVLGSQFTVIARRPDVGMVLWLFGITLWVLLIYGIFTLLTVCAEKPSLHKGIHGGWLVAVVAAQSIVILGCQLAPGFTDARLPVLFFCLVMWLGGGMLYIWMMTLIFYRYTFFVMSPADLTPPLLDQHGRGGDLDLGRDVPPFSSPMAARCSRRSCLSSGPDPFLLGDGDLVDPDAGDPWCLAAPGPPVPPALRPALLGRGLSTRDVHRLHPAPFGDGFGSLPAPARRAFRLCGVRGLGGGVYGTRPPYVLAAGRRR